MIRRRFLSSLGAAIAVQPPPIPAQSTSANAWQPARHAEDDWFDKIPGKHRLVFDTTTPEGFGEALLYSNNFLDANKNAYGLDYSDVALVIVVRHNSTAFAYNDAIWSKYGGVFAQRLKFNDPRTKEPPSVNLYNAEGYGTMLTSFGVTLESVTKRGAHLAVCRLATRNLAEGIARTTGGVADKVNEELIANIVANAHMVPAGIVAVSRAQERGYTFAYAV
jgi:intracellular sulfur oxidation DsrE/DsrF family protein